MEFFEIQGGCPLNGEVTVSGAKNVALKVLIASLLTDEEVVVKNVPLISDLSCLLEIVRELGAEASLTPDHIMRIKAKGLCRFTVNHLSFGKLRASFLLLIPLLKRFNEAKVPLSGGDKIGVRPIDRTIEGLKKMGAEVNFEDGYYHAKAKTTKSISYEFSKNTHTGTEALLMAACLTSGKTVLKNAAQEPEVDDLINFLNSMGAKIKRKKSRIIEIEGVKTLHKTTYSIMPDRNEAVTFAIAAVLTKGKLNIGPLNHSHLEEFYRALKGAGINYVHKDNRLIIDGEQRPIFANNISTSFYPGFMTDWQAPWTLLMTQAEGVSQVYEKVFDNRFGYISELVKMGAEIIPLDINVSQNPNDYNFNITQHDRNIVHAVEIYGPTVLTGQELLTPDLRAGATLVLAALTACGKSRLFGIEHIDRGYEKFGERLKELGAKIERINDV